MSLCYEENKELSMVDNHETVGTQLLQSLKQILLYLYYKLSFWLDYGCGLSIEHFKLFIYIFKFSDVCITTMMYLYVFMNR